MLGAVLVQHYLKLKKVIHPLNPGAKPGIDDKEFTYSVNLIENNKPYKIKVSDINKWNTGLYVDGFDVSTKTIVKIKKLKLSEIYTETVVDIDGNTYKVRPENKDKFNGKTDESIEILDGNSVRTIKPALFKDVFTHDISKDGVVYKIKPADISKWKAREEVTALTSDMNLTKITRNLENAEIYTKKITSFDNKVYYVKPDTIFNVNDGGNFDVYNPETNEVSVNTHINGKFDIYSKEIITDDTNIHYFIKPSDNDKWMNKELVEAYTPAGEKVNLTRVSFDDIYNYTLTDIDGNTYKVKPELSQSADGTGRIIKVFNGTKVVDQKLATYREVYSKSITAVDDKIYYVKSDVEYDTVNGNTVNILDNDNVKEFHIPGYKDVLTSATPSDGYVYIKEQDTIIQGSVLIATDKSEEFNAGTEVKALMSDELVTVKKSRAEEVYTAEVHSNDDKTYKIKPTDVQKFNNHEPVNALVDGVVKEVTNPTLESLYTETLTDIDGKEYKVKPTDSDKANGSGNTVNALVDGVVVSKKLATYEEVYSEEVEFEGHHYRLKPTDVEAFHNYHAVNSYDPINKTITSVTKPDDEEIFTLEVHDFDETYHIRPADEAKWNNHEEIDVLTKDGVDQAHKRTNEQYYTETVTDNVVGKSYKVHANKVDDFNNYNEVDALDGIEVRRVVKTDPKSVYSHELHIGDTVVQARPEDVEKYNIGEEISVIKNADLAAVVISKVKKDVTSMYTKDVTALNTALNGDLVTVKANPDDSSSSAVLDENTVKPVSSFAHLYDRVVTDDEFDTSKRVSKDTDTYLVNIRSKDLQAFNGNENVVAFDTITTKYMLISSDFERVNPYLNPKIFTRTVYIDGKEVRIIPDDIADFINNLNVAYLDVESNQVKKLNVSEGQRALSLKITTANEAKEASKDEDLDLKPDIKNLVSITTEKIVKLEHASNPEIPVEFARDRMLVKPEYNFMEFENVRDGLWVVLGERGTDKYELVGLSTNREEV